MLLANCIFRMGGAAIVLSNRRQDKSRAKYYLQHLVRTHKGADDASYNAIFQMDDEHGNKGVSLSKDLVSCVSRALKTNCTVLGPLILPMSEQVS